MRAKKSTSVKVNPEPGVHVGRLYGVLDWGSQVDKFSGDDGRPKVEFLWELPGSLHVFNEDKGEQPLIVSRKYGNTLGKGSAMKDAIEGMLGHKIDKDFEIDSLIDTYCQISLTVEEDGDNTNVVIQALMPLSKDQTKKKFIKYNDPIVLDLDNFDQDVFDSLPEWKRTKIASSKEYAEAVAGLPVKNVATKSNGKATAKESVKAVPAKQAPAKTAAKAPNKNVFKRGK